MQIAELIENITNIEIDNFDDKQSIEVTSIQNDSRRCNNGSLFVAKSGHKKDGRNFVDQAIKAGAVAVIIDNDYQISDKLQKSNVIFIKTDNVEELSSLIAHKFYGNHPQNIVTVTGTNGKSSVVHFCRQILTLLTKNAASIGTLGVFCNDDEVECNGLTTPDAISLNKTLAQLAEKDIEYAAIEASSHGLDQERLSGIAANVVAFTNFTRDHLDYHQTQEAYLAAKCKIFDLCVDGGTAVLNADIEEFEYLSEICAQKNIKIISYGHGTNADIRIFKNIITDAGQDVTFKIKSTKYEVSSTLIGDFQIDNLACAIAIVNSLGIRTKNILDICANVVSVKGRMERVVTKPNGASVIVDYAHTPDALEKVLTSLRNYTQNNLVVLFGCGGNRDKEKRPEMGKIACQFADKVFVTDDNPRSERSENIRASIIAGCGDGQKICEVQNRRTAINQAVDELKEGDTLVIAGKGHEQHQIVGRRKYYFDDSEVAQNSVSSILWESADVDAAIGAESMVKWWATGVSIDSRDIKEGDIFIALKGDNFDGHKFVKDAFKNGASAAIISKNVTGVTGDDKPLLKVKDTKKALVDLAIFARKRSKAKIIAVTGSVGKTGIKDSIFTLLEKHGKTHSTIGNLNNDIGLPLSLARLAADKEYAVFEIGINKKGEMKDLAAILRPNIVVISAIENAHTEFLGSILDVADEKATIFDAVEEGGSVVLPFDSSLYPRLVKRAQDAGISNIKDIRNFGVTDGAQYKLINGSEFRNGMKVDIDCNGTKTWYKINFLGRHHALNSLAVMAVMDICGVDIRKAARNYMRVRLADGRGNGRRMEIAGCNVVVINDSYNACPASMNSAFVTLSSSGFNSKGRLVAVLGDMLELGEKSQQLHENLLDSLLENDISAVYSTGEYMAHLNKILPDDIENEHADDLSALEEIILNNIQPNDILLFKGSNGSKIWQLLDNLISSSDEAINNKEQDTDNKNIDTQNIIGSSPKNSSHDNIIESDSDSVDAENGDNNNDADVG